MPPLPDEPPLSMRPPPPRLVEPEPDGEILRLNLFSSAASETPRAASFRRMFAEDGMEIAGELSAAKAVEFAMKNIYKAAFALVGVDRQIGLMHDEASMALEHKAEAKSLAAKLSQAQDVIGDRDSLIQRLTIQSNHFEKTAQNLETELLLAAEARDAAENELKKQRPLREKAEEELAVTAQHYGAALEDLDRHKLLLSEKEEEVAALKKKISELGTPEVVARPETEAEDIEAAKQKAQDDGWMEGFLDGYLDLCQRLKGDHPELDLSSYSAATSQMLCQSP